jgi:hypothetical protein
VRIGGGKSVTATELQDVILRNTADISELRRQISDLLSKEKRVEGIVRDLRRRLDDHLGQFDRDKYKATDQRLSINSFAHEILIFDKLGYDLGTSGSHFVLGVSALLEGRNDAFSARLLLWFAGSLVSVKVGCLLHPRDELSSWRPSAIRLGSAGLNQAIRF